jgi:hypothetical protein
MKTAKLVAAALAFAWSQAASGQTDATDWLNAPSYTHALKQYQSVSEDLYFEVVASKLQMAIYRDLKDVAVVALEENSARAFTGPYFHCPRNLHPFLLRAVYGHGGTGRFFVSKKEKSVLVAHGSMGRSSEYNKSALVACLRDLPDVVYTTVAIAE